MSEPKSGLNMNPNTWMPGIGQKAGQFFEQFTKRERKNNGQSKTLRNEMLTVLRQTPAEALKWETVTLASASLSINPLSFSASFQAPVVIQVCRVVTVDGLYLPVTAKETWEFAGLFKAFPLTRAVADRLFLQAAKIEPKPQNIIKEGDPKSDSGYDEMYDIEKRSDYLAGQNYTGVSNFGAHKIWALSKRKGSVCQAEPNTVKCTTDKNRIAINHGFYLKGKSPHPGTLLYLHGSEYGVIQNIGAAHGDDHWDYSQLLQLMRAVVPIPFKDKTGTSLMDMKTALLNGHPSLWDEPQTLTEADLSNFG